MTSDSGLKRILILASGMPEQSALPGLSAEPARAVYCGRTHLRFLDAVDKLRLGIPQTTIDIGFISAAHGLIAESTPIVPYSESFEAFDKTTAADWRQRTQVAEKIARAIKDYDLIIWLLPEAVWRSLDFQGVLPTERRHIVFATRDEAKRFGRRPHHPVVEAGLDVSIAHGVKVTEAKWHLFSLFASKIALGGSELLARVLDEQGQLAAILQPSFPDTPASFTFSEEHEQSHRLRYFMPECDDRVDAKYDFLTDQSHYARQSDLSDAFAHDPEIYGKPSYDGILISKGQIEERQYKRAYVERVGVHRYLRVPREFPVMGDCGAFTYAFDPVPPYRTDEILEYYDRYDFDFGVSIDHLIIPPVYTRTTALIRRFNESELPLAPEAMEKFKKSRKSEPSLTVREDHVTLVSDRNVVVAESKRLRGSDGSMRGTAEAIAALCREGLTFPVSSSRLARLREVTYYKASAPTHMTATRPYFAFLESLANDTSFANFEPISRQEYDELIAGTAKAEVARETLRAEKIVFYPDPDAEDASVEREIVDFKEIRRRLLLTLWNGRAFLRGHRKNGHRAIPIGAVQGWHGTVFAFAMRQFVRMGYRHLAIGGLAMARNEDILEVLRGIQPVIANRNLELHLFGVGRLELAESMITLGVTSFDSTGPLRKAWLNATANYFTPGGTAYAALRVPDPKTSPKAKKAIRPDDGITFEALKALEAKALSALRAFASHEATVEETLEAVMSYDDLLGEGRKFRELFRRTLEDRPWEDCPCAICRQIGIDVVIFRGNDRNRRRGFHNTWVFYRDLQAILRRLDEPSDHLGPARLEASLGQLKVGGES